MIKRSLFLIVLLISANEISAQWLGGYNYRKQITIQESQIPGSSDLIDFPVLINIAIDSDLEDEINGGYVNNSDGWDLVFTASDGTTLLDHDVEHYDETTGEYVAWVKIPILDHDDNTVIYLYFGYDTPLTDPCTSTTWSNGFVSVYHLHDDYLDALGSNNGTNIGSVDAIGRVADAQDFENDNSTDRIELGNFDVPNNSITISAWIKPESFDNNEARIISKATSSAEQDHYWMLATIGDGTELRFRLRTGNNTSTHFSGSGILSTGSWQYVAAVYNGVNMNLFYNGSQVGTPLAKTGSINTDPSVDVAIGNQPTSVSDWATQKKPFDGTIDEVRIISAARSSDWLSAEYNNQNSPGTFYNLGSKEDVCDSIGIDGLITNVLCRSESNGAIDINPSLGTSPYTYDWADLAGTDDPEDRSGLSAGNYSVTVTDANTCSNVAEFTVSQPFSLTLSKTNPFAALNVISSINDPEPFPSYTYTGGWGFTFPATSAVTFNYNSSFSNIYLPIGYTVDPNWLGNCVVSYTKNDAVSTSNAFHSGGERITEYQDFNPGDLSNASGDIYHLYGRGIFGFNGTAEGAHDWTITYDFFSLANGYLPAGTLLGFSDIDGINSIGENLLLTAMGTSDPWLTIFDYTTGVPAHGTAIYEASGKPANSYYFDGPAVSNQGIAYITTENLTSITINAKTGTAGSIGFKMAAPLVPFIEQDVLCYGGNDGKTTIAVAGGTEPYSYLWSNGVTSRNNPDLTEGTYSLLVTDANLCTKSVNQVITQPIDLTALISGGDSLWTMDSTLITVQLSGGTQPWKVSWPGGSELSIIGSDPLNFSFNTGAIASTTIYDYESIIVSDSNNCTGTVVGSAIVTIYKDLGLIIPQGFSPNNDGLNDTFEIIGISRFQGSRLHIFTANGSEVYYSSSYNNELAGISNKGATKGKELPGGNYFYILYLPDNKGIIKGSIYLQRE